MDSQVRKIMGWGLFGCGAMGFLYGVLAMSWLMSIIGGVVAGLGWGIAHSSR